MEAEHEEGDTASTCSRDGTNTPTHMTVIDDFWDHSTYRNAVPWAGVTFMIRDRIHD
jgi:hypothetical protein